MAQAVDTQEQFENRLRAYVRMWMERRGIGPTGLGELVGKSQPQMTRWLLGERGTGVKRDAGTSAYMLYRICKAFPIDPDELISGIRSPPERFWKVYVPHATQRGDGARERPTPSSLRPAPREPKSRIPASDE